jgi:hypothetical protein
MDPQWFFSTPQLAEYMPIAVGKRWNTSDVGIKLEAFAVAGSNIMSMSFFVHFFFYSSNIYSSRYAEDVEGKG